MNQAPGFARFTAHLLVRHAARRLPFTRAAWAEPMRHEVDSLESDLAALRWAAGCVIATYSERIDLMRAASFAPLLGAVALTVIVFGGYLISGGSLKVILEALPTISMTVVFGSLAATSILTSAGGPGIFESLGAAFHGRRFRKQDYRTLAGVLMDTRPEAPSAGGDPAFADATRMIADAKALLDHLENGGAEQMGAILQARVAAILTGHCRAVRVIGLLSRSLLWFSALAFMLGLLKILSVVASAPADVLGGMFAHAMIAPLLGVFLACILHPLASRLEAGISDDGNFFEMIRMAFLCRRGGADTALAVRTACGALPADLALDQDDLDRLPALSAAHPA